MIDIQTIEVSGIKGAMHGMRHPFKSTDKSDTEIVGTYTNGEYLVYSIGPKDLELAQKLLRSGGDDHSKFMRMIHVQADIRAPLYWWKEMDTNKVATVANSESTMHTIHMREFTLDDFSVDEPDSIMLCLIDALNGYRKLYLEADSALAKRKAFRKLIQILPDSYMQTRTWDADYQTIRRIYFARRHHKLDEWASGKNGFVAWVNTLPYAKELITYEEQNKPVKEVLNETQNTQSS